MAMRALESDIHVGDFITLRPIDIFVSDMDRFMETFDQALTHGQEESWDVWAKRNKVEQRKVSDEEYLIIAFIGLSTYMRDPFNKAELLSYTYDANCYLHGGEDEYLSFLHTLLQ